MSLLRGVVLVSTHSGHEARVSFWYDANAVDAVTESFEAGLSTDLRYDCCRCCSFSSLLCCHATTIKIYC